MSSKYNITHRMKLARKCKISFQKHHDFGQPYNICHMNVIEIMHVIEFAL